MNDLTEINKNSIDQYIININKSLRAGRSHKEDFGKSEYIVNTLVKHYKKNGFDVEIKKDREDDFILTVSPKA